MTAFFGGGLQEIPHVLRYCLFTKLLEIERGDFDGLDRKAVRLVEDIRTQIEHGLLSASFHSSCFHSFLGLLHLRYKPIWPLAVHTLSFLTNMHFQSYWNRIFERVKALHFIILSNARCITKTPTNGTTVNSETVNDAEVSERERVKKVDDATDEFTELSYLLQAIKGNSVPSFLVHDPWCHRSGSMSSGDKDSRMVASGAEMDSAKADESVPFSGRGPRR